MFTTIFTIIKNSKLLTYAVYLLALVLLVFSIYRVGVSDGKDIERKKLNKEYTEVLTKINENNTLKLQKEMTSYKILLENNAKLKELLINEKNNIKTIVKKDKVFLNKECKLEQNTKDKFNKMIDELGL